MRRFVAEKLRDLATWLDGRETIDRKWHEANVRGANLYIGRTERYIAALEAYIEREVTCVVCKCLLLPQEGPRYCEDTCHPDEDQSEAWRDTYLNDPVRDLRKKHERFDTKPMVESGVWP